MLILNLEKIIEKFSSWHKDLIIFIFFGAISILVLYPFLFQEKLILSSDSDALYYYYPTFDFYSKALKNGESFLWNPLLLSGFPTYLSQSAGFFDPLNLVIAKYFSSSILGYNFRLFLDFLLVLIFSYLAGRSFGISRLASIFIGTSYLLAFHWRFLSNLLIANSLFVLPFIFYVFNKLLNSFRKWPWILFGGFGIGLAFLGGYAQFIIYTIFLLGLYSLTYFFFINEGRKSFRYFISFFTPILLMILISAFIGLPQILPALEFTPLTIRSGGLDYSATILKVIEPGDFSLFLFPDYLYFPYLSSGRKSLYLGAFYFLLAVTGFFIWLDRFKKKDITHGLKVGAILFGLFTFSLIASMKWSPIFYFMNKLPVFEYFRFPYRWMYLGIWFLAVIGAYGFDLLKDYSNNFNLRKSFKIIGILIGIIFISILILNFGGDIFWSHVMEIINFIFPNIFWGRFGFSKDPNHYLEAIQRGIYAWQEFTSFKKIDFLIPFFILISSFALLVLFIWNKLGWLRFKILGFSLSLLTFLSIFMVQWSNNTSNEKVFDHQNILEKFITPKDFLIYRTYPFMLDYGFSKLVPPKYAISKDELMALTDLQFASGWANMNFYSGIQSVDGYEPFTTKDLFFVLGEIGSTLGGEEFTKKLSENDKIKRLLDNLEIIGMMAGKYIISGIELNRLDLKLLTTQYVSKYKIPIFIYKNKKAIPKFYFAKNIIFSHNKSLSDLMQDGQKNFSDFTYLDCDDCNLVKPKGEAKMQNLIYKNGFMSMTIDSDFDKWLIISESYLPGWSAEVDGQSVTIRKANGLYMALLVPRGTHKIILHYDGILNEGKILRYLKLINY